VKRLRLRNQKQKIDKKLLFTALLLVFVGLVAVADASAPQALNIFNDKYRFLKDQLIWAAVGLIALFAAAKINYRFWEKIALPFFLVTILLLVAVLIPGVGMKALGARRWISVGPIFFQPSELAKFGLVLFLAKLVSKKKPSVLFFIPLVITAGLIMLEPDLGTTVVIASFGMILLFASRINFFHFAALGILGVLAVFLSIITSSYRKARLATFLQETQDPLGRSYHIRQILLALGSGGFFGVGLGQSRQKYLFLPEAANDSIFAVIAEEVGFIGALVLLSILTFFIIRALRTAKHAPCVFSQFLALGIAAWIGSQTILNIASMIALIPLTGIPLPFISYGGSSLISVLFATGILLNISKYMVHARTKK